VCRRGSWCRGSIASTPRGSAAAVAGRFDDGKLVAMNRSYSYDSGQGRANARLGGGDCKQTISVAHVGTGCNGGAGVVPPSRGATATVATKRDLLDTSSGFVAGDVAIVADAAAVPIAEVAGITLS
jgi:hypothetical protein